MDHNFIDCSSAPHSVSCKSISTELQATQRGQPGASKERQRVKENLEVVGQKCGWNSGSSIGLGPLFVSFTIVRVEAPSYNSDRAALPLPEHWSCSDSSASGWWSLRSWGNCNPPSSPRETRTRRSDPASLQTQSPNKNGGEKNHNSTMN